MTPATFLTTAIIPALALLRDIPDAPGVRVQLLATAVQESGLAARVQAPGGQARSFMQMEKNGAVLNVLTNAHTGPRLHAICADLVVPVGLDEVFEAIAWHDVLACVMARLQYWLSPLAIPDVGDKAAALAMYASVWRPAWALAGEPEPGRWDASYAAAVGG